jgi:hypothetical protein
MTVEQMLAKGSLALEKIREGYSVRTLTNYLLGCFHHGIF